MLLDERHGDIAAHGATRQVNPGRPQAIEELLEAQSVVSAGFNAHAALVEGALSDREPAAIDVLEESGGILGEGIGGDGSGRTRRGIAMGKHESLVIPVGGEASGKLAPRESAIHQNASVGELLEGQICSSGRLGGGLQGAGTRRSAAAATEPACSTQGTRPRRERAAGSRPKARHIDAAGRQRSERREGESRSRSAESSACVAPIGWRVCSVADTLHGRLSMEAATRFQSGAAAAEFDAMPDVLPY